MGCGACGGDNDAIRHKKLLIPKRKYNKNLEESPIMF